MISRVTSSSINTTLSNQISTQYSNYAKITEQLSTGNRINSIMDDPIQAVNILSSNRQLNRLGTWSANIKVLNNEIKDSSETIDKMLEKVQRAKDLATTAANGTSTKSTLEATLTELNQIIEGMVDFANTNYNGNYIYGGTNTKTPPYEILYGIDATGNKTDEIVGVKYNGTKVTDEWQRQLEIADGLFQTVNITGDAAFGQYLKEPVFEADGVTPVLDAEGNPTYTVTEDNGIMSDLIKLQDAIKETIKKLDEQENLPEDASQADKEAIGAEIKACYDSISGLLDGFTKSMDVMTGVNERFGTITNKLTMSEESIADSELNLESFISEIKEVDVLKAVGEWYQSQYALQASMQASTSIMSMSLLNYI